MNPDSTTSSNAHRDGRGRRDPSISVQLLDTAAIEHFRPVRGVAIGRSLRRELLTFAFALADASPATIVVHSMLAVEIADKLDRHIAEQAFLRRLRNRPPLPAAPHVAPDADAPTLADPNVLRREADRWLSHVTDPRVMFHPSLGPVDLHYVGAAVGHLGAEARDKTALVFTTSEDEASAKVMLFLLHDELAVVLRDEIRAVVSCMAEVDDLEDALADRW